MVAATATIECAVMAGSPRASMKAKAWDPGSYTMAEFETNLMRAQLAATWFSLCLQTAHDLLGKSYLSLSQAEKTAVDQVVLANVGANFQAITPEWLAAQPAQQPMGFQAPTGTRPQATTSPPPPKR
jgi:hypothetical protein